MDNWRTYTEAQAARISSVIKYLLDRGLLEEEEERVARGILNRLRGVRGGELLAFTDAEDKLLRQLEESVWER